MLKVLLLTLGALIPNAIFAQSNLSKLKPLYFQADKNHLQILPQRFEYTLMDEDKLKIGDILIDFTQVSFQIEPSAKKGVYNVSFTWPSGLMNTGLIAIKNNSGKAILNKKIEQADITISQPKKDQTDSELRSAIATTTLNDVESNIIKDMEYYPFMVLCIYRETENTKIYLCSKELYLTNVQGQFVIKPRAGAKKEPQVEINGTTVGNQGSIYLNDRSENVAFRADTQSGAFLEIETRKKDVDFKDVIVSDNGEKIILTASGAEPVESKNTKKISNDEWQVSIPKNRPVVYLKGDGDIPMRQEFYVKGELPTAKNRVYLSAKSPWQTYSSTLDLKGVTAEGVTIKVPSADENADINILKKNQFIWKIKSIQDSVEKRYLDVKVNNQEFTARYDIVHGKPFNLELSLQHQTPSAISYAHFEIQWWLENMFSVNSSWSHLHWGILFARQQHLTEKESQPKLDFTSLELLWRSREGFNLVDETWGLSLPMQLIQSENTSITAQGLSWYLLKKTDRDWLKSFADWTELKTTYFFSSTGQDVKLKSALQLKAKALVKINSDWYAHYGMEFSDYKFDPGLANEESQLGLDIGLLWNF